MRSDNFQSTKPLVAGGARSRTLTVVISAQHNERILQHLPHEMKDLREFANRPQEKWTSLYGTGDQALCCVHTSSQVRTQMIIDVAPSTASSSGRGALSLW